METMSLRSHRTACPHRTTFRRRATSVYLALATALAGIVVAVQPAADVAEAAADDFTAITPARMLDTRDGTGGRTGALRDDETITLDLAGEGDIPNNATAVVINITSTKATLPGYVTAWPTGEPRPLTASLNLDPGQDTPNLVIIGLGNGSINLYNSAGSTHLVGDVTGYFTGSSELTPTAPARLLDTRDGTGGTDGPVNGDSTITLQVTGTAGVPTTASAVVVNVTSIQATAPAYVTVFPTGSERPLAATLNTEPGQNTPNLAIARLSTDGRIDMYVSAGQTHLTADVMGYFENSSEFVPASPHRVLDTRQGLGADPEPLGADAKIDVQIAGVGPIPANASSVVVNITSIASTEPSYLTAWPTDTTRPLAASLNTEPGQNTPNLAVLKLGDDGMLTIYNRRGTTHLTADVAGWYLSEPPAPRIMDLTDRNRVTLSGTGHVEDNGLTSGGSYTWNTDTRRLQVDAGASAFATAQDFRAWAKLRADFYPYTANGDFSIDLDWWGTMTSFVGASASAEMYLAVRLIPLSGSSANTTIWEHVFADDGIGSGLKALEVLKIAGDDQRTFTLPTLDTDTYYRMEVELRCRVRVVFSVGATACDARGGDRDARVDSWSISFTE
jgi:hypothetical protein